MVANIYVVDIAEENTARKYTADEILDYNQEKYSLDWVDEEEINDCTLEELKKIEFLNVKIDSENCFEITKDAKEGFLNDRYQKFKQKVDEMTFGEFAKENSKLDEISNLISGKKRDVYFIFGMYNEEILPTTSFLRECECGKYKVLQIFKYHD